MTRRGWIVFVILSFFIVAIAALALSQNVQTRSGVEQAADLSATAVQESPTIPPTALPTPNKGLARSSTPLDPTFSEVTGTQYFTDCAFRTGTNAVIGIPADVTLEGTLELEPGDEIAIYLPDGSLCAGAAVWTGSNIALTAWQDDPQTDEIDGLQEGDEMLFVVWDKSAGEEVKVTAVGYEMGDGVYTADGIYMIRKFSGG